MLNKNSWLASVVKRNAVKNSRKKVSRIVRSVQKFVLDACNSVHTRVTPRPHLVHPWVTPSHKNRHKTFTQDFNTLIILGELNHLEKNLAMSVEKALQTMIDNMPEKTGKSLDQWKKLLAKQSFTKHSEAVKYLKTEHGVTHGFANTIVGLSKDDDNSEDDLVANQYNGKEALTPIYDALILAVGKFGDDITITPKKSSVSVIRKRQFVLIKPTTKTRIDLGLKIKGQDPEGCLENSGPFGTMCSHRIRLEKVEDIDQEVIGWMKQAYEQSV